MYYLCEPICIYSHLTIIMNILKNKIWMHKWGIPILHAILWIIGLLITTDFLGILKLVFPSNSAQYAISLGAVVVIFFGEIILTFIDCAIEKENSCLNMTFCNFIASLIATIVAIVVFMFLGCYFIAEADTQWLGKFLISLVILVSATTKGMEIWLQNNWDKYTLDNTNKLPKLNFSM